MNDKLKMALWAFAAFAAFALMVSSCLTGGSNTTTTSSPSSNKYRQTWAKRYSETTCQEWSSDMTEQQRFAAAADMLTGARNKGDGGQGVPPDSLIREFQSGITNACSPIPSLTIADAAVGLYMTERDRFSP